MAARFGAARLVAGLLLLAVGISGSGHGWAQARARAAGAVSGLLLPSALAYDAAGDLFFADARRNQVFELTLGGALQVVAGTGEQGFAGDGGAATAAVLDGPQGLAVGGDGTLYIADTGNARVRVVRGGTISTFAGTALAGFGGDGGPALAAKFLQPGALALDASGGLLICDRGNERVRRVSAGVVTTWAGSGVQGFGGDGGPATAALLDSPAGVAVAADGRVFVADSHNHRVRVVAADGTIATFAGTGVQGYGGDGGAATSARLALPRGLVVSASGTLLIADADNQRIRAVDATGTISTVAGAGFQGLSPDATSAAAAGLNGPRAVAVSSFGNAVFADSANTLVREVAATGQVYTLAVAAVPRVSTVTVAAPATWVYGTGSAAISVAGTAVPQGSVSLLDAGNAVGTGVLSGAGASAAATIPLAGLGAGPHVLTAQFSGDGLNPAGMSAATDVTVSPAAVVATADAVQAAYGAAIPVLTGSVTGLLAQDAGRATVDFASTATALSPVGTYGITATLRGPASANYVVSLATGSGAVTIVPAATAVTVGAVAQGYSGMPVVLAAKVSPATNGTPTGVVTFSDGGVAVGSAAVVNGTATLTELTPVAGAHAVVATYGGDGNFLAASSAPSVVTIAAMPDFALSSNAATQAVQGGLVASFPLAVSSQSTPFTGSVLFSVTGLPAGATAAFSPAVVVPGAGGAAVTMTVQTVVLSGSDGTRGVIWWALLVVPGAMLLRRRRAGVLCAGCVVMLSGCGARTVSESGLASARSYSLAVMGTSTNLAGAVVTHSVPVTLTVE